MRLLIERMWELIFSPLFGALVVDLATEDSALGPEREKPTPVSVPRSGGL